MQGFRTLGKRCEVEGLQPECDYYFSDFLKEISFIYIFCLFVYLYILTNRGESTIMIRVIAVFLYLSSFSFVIHIVYIGTRIIFPIQISIHIFY